MFLVACLMVALLSNALSANVLQLQEVGDFVAQNCLQAQNLIRSTNFCRTPKLSYEALNRQFL